MTMQQDRGGMGSHKHGISGHAPRSPRYKFMQQLVANKEKPKTRPRLTAKTLAEAMNEEKSKRAS
jgi:hypothetical protein